MSSALEILEQRAVDSYNKWLEKIQRHYSRFEGWKDFVGKLQLVEVSNILELYSEVQRLLEALECQEESSGFYELRRLRPLKRLRDWKIVAEGLLRRGRQDEDAVLEKLLDGEFDIEDAVDLVL